MRRVFKNAHVFISGAFSKADVLVEGGIIEALKAGIDTGCDRSFDFEGCFIIPGLADVHVHLREPGFSYKETIATGTAAAAAGGFTDVCSMPNLAPPPDCPESLRTQLDIIERDAKIRVHPYACITKGGTGRGELVDFAALQPDCCAFSDDGKGVQIGDTMKRAMLEVERIGGLIAAHCEDERLLKCGYIHEGRYARAHSHLGISSESEWRQLERDVELVEQTGCRYHVCHVSTAESVEIIRQAKKRGLPVTCETAPHYLALCEDDLQEDGRFKMNPPLRSAADREALIAGILDGTIDIIATDHAPHSAEEKAMGLAGSAMGVVGLETALSVVYTYLCRTGLISLEQIIELMSTNPRRIFGLNTIEIKEGAPADFTVFDPNHRYYVNPDEFHTRGHATPFAGAELYGRPLLTMCGGELVYGGED